MREFAFQLEIELLGKVARHIDARAPHAKTIVDRRRTEASFESENIARLILHLEKSAEGQLDLGSAGHHVERFLLFLDLRLLDIRFGIGNEVRSLLRRERRRRGSRHRGRRLLLLQALDFLFQLRVALLQELDRSFEFLEALRVGLSGGGFRRERQQRECAQDEDAKRKSSAAEARY